jgi:hypothetical protein
MSRAELKSLRKTDTQPAVHEETPENCSSGCSLSVYTTRAHTTREQLHFIARFLLLGVAQPPLLRVEAVRDGTPFCITLSQPRILRRRRRRRRRCMRLHGTSLTVLAPRRPRALGVTEGFHIRLLLAHGALELQQALGEHLELLSRRVCDHSLHVPGGGGEGSRSRFVMYADFPLQECSPYSCTRTTRTFGICPSLPFIFCRHVKPRYNSQLFHRCTPCAL